MDDLDKFRNGKDLYKRIGKAWKRGYLLYGPPGTGKSTMIAAMANYLNYDIYDIELTTVHCNNDLRKLLMETTSKSIIVIEDIDCSLDLTGQRSDSGALPVHSGITSDSGKKRKRTSVTTLSGLLNFTDGIWSAADMAELIIVFTTNFLDKLDPALIRRGRMDMHVEMSYCCFEAFTTLAKNYLGVDDHPLFDTVKELLQSVEITPADVSECLMTSEGTDDGADACLGFLIKELNKKKSEKVDRNTEVAQEEIPATPNGKGSSCVDEHPLFNNVKELLQSVEITPVDVVECLMTSEGIDHGADACLGFLIKELKKKKATKLERDTEGAEEEVPAKPNGKGDMANGQRMLGHDGNVTDDSDGDSGEDEYGIN